MFVSLRMAETHLLSKYIHYLRLDILYKCTSVNRRFIHESEAKLLNEINQEHADCVYGEKMFIAGKNCIVRLEDVQELYTFLEVCYNRLLCKNENGQQEKFGFLRIDSSKTLLPYCIKDNQKYVPLFCFKIENLTHQSIKMENWNLAYLKLCCQVHGIRNDLIVGDSCQVTSLEIIKNYFPPNTNFEDYWPPMKTYSHLLINQNNSSTHVSTPDARNNPPPQVETAESTIPHTLTAPAIPESVPMMMNTFEKKPPKNEQVCVV